MPGTVLWLEIPVSKQMHVFAVIEFILCCSWLSLTKTISNSSYKPPFNNWLEILRGFLVGKVLPVHCRAKGLDYEGSLALTIS